MKKTRYINLLAIAGLLFVAFACDQADGRQIFEGPYYVQLTSSSASISEADENSTVTIQVSNVGPTLDSDIVVTYSTDGSTAVEGVDYELAAGQTSGEIVIPAGEHFGSLQLNTINNDETDGDKTLAITLVSANNGLSAGSGAIGVSYSLAISDDDCPFDITAFPGAYDVSWVQSAGWIWDAGENTGFVSSLTATATANVYDTDNLLGATDGGQNDVQLVALFVDDVAETVAIYDDGSGAQEFYKNTSFLQRYAVGTGAGEVGTCGPTFSFSYDVLREDVATVAVSVTATYSKQ